MRKAASKDSADAQHIVQQGMFPSAARNATERNVAVRVDASDRVDQASSEWKWSHLVWLEINANVTLLAYVLFSLYSPLFLLCVLVCEPTCVHMCICMQKPVEVIRGHQIPGNWSCR